jgi:hypothetical protein
MNVGNVDLSEVSKGGFSSHHAGFHHALVVG